MALLLLQLASLVAAGVPASLLRPCFNLKDCRQLLKQVLCTNALLQHAAACCVCTRIRPLPCISMGMLTSSYWIDAACDGQKCDVDCSTVSAVRSGVCTLLLKCCNSCPALQCPFNSRISHYWRWSAGLLDDVVHTLVLLLLQACLCCWPAALRQCAL
jgi:hypothetical protein